MMKIARVLFAFVAVFAATAWAQVPQAQYFRPMSAGLSDFKIAAMQELMTPDMMAGVSYMSTDPRIQEMVGLSRALDVLLYDGLRLVRYRGALVTNGAVDQNAVDRAVYYFNVNATEAKAWLVASRLMQVIDFKDDGAALTALEYDLMQTASDLYLRLRTYIGNDAALRCMPRIAAHWKGYDRQVMPQADMRRVFTQTPEHMSNMDMPAEDAPERMMIIRMPR